MINNSPWGLLGDIVLVLFILTIMGMFDGIIEAIADRIRGKRDKD